MSELYQRTILIRPQDLNHAGTVFGGTMMAWADELAFITATLSFPGCTFVTKVFREFVFETGPRQGDIVLLEGTVDRVGNTSITVRIKARNAVSGAPIFETDAVMVNVAAGKAVPISGKI